MSVWRRKAIECLPELKKDFEQPNTSIYDVFFELLSAVVAAHKQNDREKLEKIYSFAEWCFRQKEQELWNAAGVAFYEHLGDSEETLAAMSQWISPQLYKEVRDLLELRIEGVVLQKLDNRFIH